MKMAGKDELIENFKLLTAETCTEEWVNSVWENYFTSYDGLDQNLDPETLIEVLENLSAGLNGFVGHRSEEGLWTVLVENDISIKAIIAFLGYLMAEGHKNKIASLLQRELSISATRVYLKMLMVPDSGVFKTFNPVPYEHGVDFLKLYTVLEGNSSSRTKKKSSSAKLSTTARNKSKRSSKNKTNDPSFDEDEEEDEGMSAQDISSLKKMLYGLLQDVITMLETLSLKSEPSSACHTIQILVKLTQHEVDTFNANFAQSAVRQDRLSIPALAYRGIESLCSPLHCDKNILINAMCKHMLPSLLMVGGDGTTNKQQHTIQNQATAFICHLIEQLGAQCMSSIRSLVQHMCTKVPDKMEYRNSAVQGVVTILQALPVHSYNSIVHWIDNRLAKHKEVSNRGFAVEVVSALLELPQRQPAEDAAQDQAPVLSHKSLIRTLVDSCSDVAPVVRARAIACFGQCLNSVDDHVAGALREIVTPAMPERPLGPVRLVKTPGGPETVQDTRNEDGSVRSEVTIAQQTVEGSTTVTIETDQGEGQRKQLETPLCAVHLTPGFNPNLTDSEGIFSMLRRRARDDKVHVRKAALQALERAVIFEGHNYTKQNVEVLKEHCRDPGLSARKQAMQSLTELLTSRTEDTFIQEKWLKGVLPLALDREQTLSDKCMELLEDLLLNNIVPYHRSKAEPHKLAWSMLAIMSTPECDGPRRYLTKACRHWGRSGKIKLSVISSLESHVGTENNTSALMLLAEIISSHSKVSRGFIQQCWTKVQDSGNSQDILRVMKIMSYAAKHQQAEDLETLIADLTNRLQEYQLSPNLIPTAISTLSKLCDIHAEMTGLKKPKQWDWCIKLLASTDKSLSKDILQDPNIPKNEDMVIAHLSTLGEVAQLCPGKVTKRARLLVLSIIAKPCITSEPCSQPPASDHNDSGETSKDPVSSQASQQSQSSQSSQNTQSSQPISQFRGSTWSSHVKAVAFSTLGKLCLQREKLTKKCVAALAWELEVSTDPVIRNNVMIVMCDLCVRYTTTANQYIGTIASCLKDPVLLVRLQTLTMITILLQQDFLKWKGALFYRYIACVVDDDEELAEFAKTCLVILLIKPNPNLFFQHFIECFFHFNDYRDHNTFNRFPQIDRDRELFALNGEKNAKKRHELYKFLLQTMVDEQKFKLQKKMGQEILNAIVEGVLPLNEKTKPILKDALIILCSKEIKLTVLRNQTAADPDMDLQQKTVHMAKKFIITQIVRKNMMEEIIPKVVDLKQILVKQRSPLLKEVMLYLLELNKDYKKEIQEIADRQLVTEIEFDLRKFEEQQQREAEEQNVTPAAQGSPVATDPRSSPRSGSASPAVRTTGGTMPSTPPRSPAVGSPGLRSPAVRSPARQFPAVHSPAKNFGSPKPCTPHRKQVQSVSKVAILNSARRAMERNKATTRVPMEPIDQSTDSRPELSDTNNSSESGNGATPKDSRHLYRAISTPAAAMTDITFHGDGNMTFLPPSPIPETAPVQRMYDESNFRLSSGREESDVEPQVVCINLPAEALTPAEVTTRSSDKPITDREDRQQTSAEEEEEAPVPLATIQPAAANQRRASTRKSQSKDSPKPKDQLLDSTETQKTKVKGGRKRKR